MGLFDDDIESALTKGLAHGLCHIGGALIGGAIAGAFDSSVRNGQSVKVSSDNDDSGINTTVRNQNIVVSPRGEYKVVKCPGCGHRSSIVDGDGSADYCEYCGTAIGN